MRDDSAIMRDALLTVRQQLDQRRIPHKVSAAKAGVSVSTWFSWFPADGTPQVPSLASLDALLRALPIDLANLLMPDGWAAVRVPEGIDHDEIGEWAERYAARKLAAHREDSPAGRDIADCEHRDLASIVVEFPGKAA